MQKPEKIDLTQLLGFETVTNEPTDMIFKMRRSAPSSARRLVSLRPLSPKAAELSIEWISIRRASASAGALFYHSSRGECCRE